MDGESQRMQKKTETIDIEIEVTESGLALFLPLLEKGLTLPVQTGCSIRDFFCKHLGLPENYLDQRIQTLFLNAKPVDNVDTALIRDGSTLALSAAMPGILGATMRKAGRYAAFRETISQPDGRSGQPPLDGRVRVKLFNMVVREIGGLLLQKGGRIEGSNLWDIARRHEDALFRRIHALKKNGCVAEPAPEVFADLVDQPVNLTLRILPDVNKQNEQDTP